MLEILLRARTPEELSVQLSEMNVDVPARSDGRSTHHVERYCLVSLLASLPFSRFSFPFVLTHTDRPDFFLELPDVTVGIEHTEAVPPNVARADTLREEMNNSKMYFIPRVRPGERKKASKKLIREIEANEPGDGWLGDEPEREWAEAMAYTIERKLHKAKASGFMRGTLNWLMVYDNWPLPAVEYKKAASYLLPVLREIDSFAVFDSIFVFDCGQMCEFLASEIKFFKPNEKNLKNCNVTG